MTEKKKTVKATVIKANMEKTVVVAIKRVGTHPQYGKVVSSTTKLHAHDEQDCRVGDKVEIEETRPMSKMKAWKVVNIIERTE